MVDIMGSATGEVMSTRATRRSLSSRVSSATQRRQKPQDPSYRRIGRRAAADSSVWLITGKCKRKSCGPRLTGPPAHSKPEPMGANR